MKPPQMQCNVNDTAADKTEDFYVKDIEDFAGQSKSKAGYVKCLLTALNAAMKNVNI